MSTQNIVKAVGIASAVIGLLTLVANHPILVAMIVIGVAAFYVADRIL